MSFWNYFCISILKFEMLSAYEFIPMLKEIIPHLHEFIHWWRNSDWDRYSLTVLSKWTLIQSNSSFFLNFYDFINFKMSKHRRNILKTHNFLHFLVNNVIILKILLINLIFFLLPKFLELYFTPENTPPKLKNSNMS